MRVEFWADIVCSWCGIAERRVEAGIAAFEHPDRIELVHRAFRLTPDAPEDESLPFAEHLGEHGVPHSQVRQIAAQVEQVAAQDGIHPYHIFDNRVGNTTRAHELVAHAQSRGLGERARRVLFDAHFGERAALWTIEDLLPLAERIGLDPTEARAALDSRTHRDQVTADHDAAVALGARGVPFLVIDRRIGVSGAQPSTTITDALRQAWSSRPGAGSDA